MPLVSESTEPTGDDPVEDPLGDRLLAAAAAEFAARGYAGARVAEIARRAGGTTGAIYSRYRGKTDLLAAALGNATAGEFDALFADHRFQGRMEDILLIAGSHLVDRSEPDESHGATPGMLLESFTAARHEPEVKAMVDAAVANFGRLDVGVNNAGMSTPMKSFVDTREADLDLNFAVNAKGVFFGMKHQIAQMLTQGGGVGLEGG